MIEILPFDNEKVVGIRVTGKIETEELEKVTSLIERKLQVHDKLNIYVEFEEGFLKMSGEALLKDIRFSFRHLGDFAKEAVVTDKNWIGKLISVTDKLFPSIEVRHFSKDEIAEAREWIQS